MGTLPGPHVPQWAHPGLPLNGPRMRLPSPKGWVISLQGGLMASHEARLVTVVTLWAGHHRMKCCNQNVRWVDALLAPYLDHRLRVQTMVAHLPVLPTSHSVPMNETESVAGSEGTRRQDVECE